jgi:hypothetical protein
LLIATILFGPSVAQRRRDSAHRIPDKVAPLLDDSTAPPPAQDPELEESAPGADIAGPPQVDDSTGTPTTKPKRTKRRGKAETAPAAPVVTWVQVAPGKFVRVEGADDAAAGPLIEVGAPPSSEDPSGEAPTAPAPREAAVVPELPAPPAEAIPTAAPAPEILATPTQPDEPLSAEVETPTPAPWPTSPEPTTEPESRTEGPTESTPAHVQDDVHQDGDPTTLAPAPEEPTSTATAQADLFDETIDEEGSPPTWRLPGISPDLRGSPIRRRPAQIVRRPSRQRTTRSEGRHGVPLPRAPPRGRPSDSRASRTGPSYRGTPGPGRLGAVPTRPGAGRVARDATSAWT